MAGESTVSPILAGFAIASVFAVLFVLLAAEIPSADWLRTFIHGHAQDAMFIVAATATGSSLYYSEAVGFIPCEFCWFQRIEMYSLAVILGVAVATRGKLDGRYIAALSLVGLGLSIYHYQLQMFPSQGEVCTGSLVPCSGKYIEEFGFVTIPFMAACGFLTIFLLQVSRWRVEYLFRIWNLGEAVNRPA